MVRKSKNEDLNISSQPPSEIQFKKVPHLCLIDLKTTDISLLNSHGFNCTSASLGMEVEVPNKNAGEWHHCLLNYDFPTDLHEYDIAVINLQTYEKRIFDPSEHIRSHTVSSDTRFLMIEYPATVFNPRPLSAFLLRGDLLKMMSKQSILIIFAEQKDQVKYHPLSITRQGMKRLDTVEANNYEFLDSIPDSDNLTGAKTKVASVNLTELHTLLSRYNNDCSYTITFEHPEVWDQTGNKGIKKPSFIPLMLTSQGGIISYLDFHDQTLVLVFPIIKQQGQFLLDLFNSVLPQLTPALFPYSTLFSWLNTDPYLLPNETTLLEEKQVLETEYSAKLQEVEKRISNNRSAYGYLHDLITETDKKLVKSIEIYLKWLGFPEVVNMDETNPTIKEEDLQVTTEKGPLIIEVKGISGTSKDSDCSQISKIKFRRSKQRKSFDVFALYLVNHQRNLPAENRENPPFNEQQIIDAISDERGLLTTYSLFKLYYHIGLGLITKSDAMKSLIQYGLVKFTPSNAILLGKPIELHHSGFVAVLRIADVHVTKGSRLIIGNGEDLCQTTILDIKLDNNSVNSASNADVGLKLEHKIYSNSELWLVKS